MSQQEEKNLSQEQPEEEVASREEQPPKERYVPRPKWQIAFAWVLFAIMILAVASYYYWIAYPYG